MSDIVIGVENLGKLYRMLQWDARDRKALISGREPKRKLHRSGLEGSHIKLSNGEAKVFCIQKEVQEHPVTSGHKTIIPGTP